MIKTIIATLALVSVAGPLVGIQGRTFSWSPSASISEPYGVAAGERRPLVVNCDVVRKEDVNGYKTAEHCF
jgi:hypothetical protein